MVSILLTILKILGIILLILLGLILVLLLLVLFVPVRYRLDAHRNLQEEAPVVADIKATWLLHLISVLFSYPEAAYVIVKVFGITVYRSDQEKQPKEPKKNAKKTKKADGKAGQETVPAEVENPLETMPAEAADSQETMQEDGESSPEAAPEKLENPQESEKHDDALTKPEPTLKRFFITLWEKIKNIKYTITQICDKIKHIVKNIKYYLKVIQSETFKSAFGLCSGQLFSLLKSIKPRKIKGRLLIGTGDPASTGQVLSIYGMLYPFLGNNISVIPDFEQQIIEGELLVKGRITVFKAVKMAMVIFFNKDVRSVIKLLKREAA